MAKLIVLASSPVSQAGLESVLATAPDLQVVASFSESKDLLSLLESYTVDALLMEALQLSPETQQQLAELATDDPSLAIAILTHTTQANNWAEILALGIRGLLPYSASAAEIILTLRAVIEGLVVIHPNFRSSLFQEELLVRPSLPLDEIQPLTARETEILTLLSQGLTNKAIASQIHLSEHTIKFHLAMIFEKLSASSRTEAVAIGIRQGLISL
jgi:two-component system, NarL family, response regulator YdfI